MIEFTHRTFSSITGLLIVGNAIWLWRKFKTDRQIRVLASLSVILLGAVGVMGGINVLNKLPSGLTAIDMVLASLLLAELMLLTVVVKKRDESDGNSRSAENPAGVYAEKILVKPASFATGAVFAEIVVGGFLKHSSASYTYVHPQSPLANELITHFTTAEIVMFIHVLTSSAVVFGVLWTYVYAKKQRIYYKFATGLLALVFIQAMLGFLSLVTKLELLTTTAHMAVASLMLLITVYITANVRLSTHSNKTLSGKQYVHSNRHSAINNGQG